MRSAAPLALLVALAVAAAPARPADYLIDNEEPPLSGSIDDLLDTRYADRY